MSSPICKKRLLTGSLVVTIVLLFFLFLFKLEREGLPSAIGAFFGGFPLAYPIAFVYIFLVEKYWKDSPIFKVTEG